MSSTNNSGEVYLDNIVSDLLLSFRPLGMINFFACLIRAMECVEVFTELTGAEKKKTVINAVVKFIKLTEFANTQDRDTIIFLVESGVIDSVIECIITLTKIGCKINIQKILEEKCKCCVVL